jgi:hypothetical protein
MDIQKAYKDWYKTEGIRTFSLNGEHFHEFYTEVAFLAGADAISKEYKKELDALDIRLSDLKKLIRRLINKAK